MTRMWLRLGAVDVLEAEDTFRCLLKARIAAAPGDLAVAVPVAFLLSSCCSRPHFTHPLPPSLSLCSIHFWCVLGQGCCDDGWSGHAPPSPIVVPPLCRVMFLVASLVAAVLRCRCISIAAPRAAASAKARIASTPDDPGLYCIVAVLSPPSHTPCCPPCPSAAANVSVAKAVVTVLAGPCPPRIACFQGGGCMLRRRL